MKRAIRFAIVLLVATTMFAQSSKNADAPTASFVGYLRDAGCVHRFREVIKAATQRLPRSLCAGRLASGDPDKEGRSLPSDLLRYARY
jgi:hypothetical protein